MKLSYKTKSLIAAMGFASAALVSGTASAVQTVDAGVPDYKKASGISGNLSSVGSDTLANLMTLWLKSLTASILMLIFKFSAGSSTAPPALTEGTSNLGPMSREMKDDELEAFEDKYGYKPTAYLLLSMRWLCWSIKTTP